MGGIEVVATVQSSKAGMLRITGYRIPACYYRNKQLRKVDEPLHLLYGINL